MTEKALQAEVVSNWKPKALIIGGVIGAVAGLTAAFLYIQRVEDDKEPPKISVGDGVKIGVLVLGLLRSIATLKD
jgi:hypothetical protein